MNNMLKLFLCAFIAMSVVPSYADDVTDADIDADIVDTADVKTPTVSARMDCKTIKAKIDELTPNGASDQLSQLQLQYRKDCVVRASGRRSSYRGGALTIADASNNAENAIKTNAMASASSAKVISVATTSDDTVTDVATTEISDAQKEMCERLPDAIAGAASDEKDVLQSTYDEYCKKNVSAPDAVVKTTMMVLGPAETDEEKYARIAANLDAGLCPDGTTPNKFGCCGDEKFKDLGNLEFACCPEQGECFPPIK